MAAWRCAKAMSSSSRRIKYRSGAHLRSKHEKNNGEKKKIVNDSSAAASNM